MVNDSGLKKSGKSWVLGLASRFWEQLRTHTQPQDLDAKPQIQIGTLSRGFLCDEAKLVVVTDAEIFGRYKIQRPRRLKSPHALATRSALDIDFTELEEGDLVVHLQYGIGRFLGLKNLPRAREPNPPDARSRTPDAGRNASSSSTRPPIPATNRRNCTFR